MEKHKNPEIAPEERAEDLLSRMSLEEKMSQVVGYFPSEWGKYDDLERDYPNGAGHVSCLEMRSMDSFEEAAGFQRELQEKIMNMGEHHIPAIFHMEGLCGAFIQDSVSFPSGIGRAAAWNPELEEQVARIIGRQERAVGITHTLAPVLDISRDSRMGRQGETYGEDPTLAAAMGAAYVKGLQEGTTDGRKSEAVAKHFLGFHASQGGIHGADCEVSERTLQEVYGKPFQAAITESDLRGVMPCYCSINGEPVSASKKIMTRLLRDEMGFNGVTFSDYCAVMNIHGVQKVCESYTEAGLRAMKAGMDIEVHFKKCFNEELAEWYRGGKADICILDKAVKRILEAKFRMGIFEHPFALVGELLKKEFIGQQDEKVTLQAARESLVLLKNNGILPLSGKNRKIAVVGYHASTARIFYGGYTHFSMAEGKMAAVSTMAGLQTEKSEDKYVLETISGTSIQQDSPIFEEILKKQNPIAKSLLMQVQESMPDAVITYAPGYTIAGNDMSMHDEALKAAEEAEVVIVTLGGKHGTGSIASMGEGIDATDINLPLCQEVFLEKLLKLHKPVVAVHFNGRPISSNAADACADAILEAWNPSEKGAQAITEVLLGEYNPGGKLPLSAARVSGQIPVYYNHPNGSGYHQGESIAFSEYVDMPHTPRYFFGHGLSYTQFAYSDLVVDQKQIKPDGIVKIEVTVENTGKRKGEEIVQLYFRDCFASMTRPVKELVGFRRLKLEPAEKKTVIFEVKASQMAFLDAGMSWKIEQGDIEIQIGSSSEDIRMKDTFRITEDAYIEGKSRGYYAASKVKGAN